MEKSLTLMKYEGNLSINWEKFRRGFENWLIAFGEDDMKEKKKVALFLHAVGEQGMDIYQTFELEETEKTLRNIIDKFDKYFKPKINVTYERYIFFNRKQKENESYEQYITILKNLSSTCDFGNLKEQLIKDIFVSGINNSDAKENLLKIPDLTLEKALEICRTKEVAAKQTKNIEKEIQDIEVIRRNTKVCGKCLKSHQYGKCPAYGKTCSNCEKMGHFARACKLKGHQGQLDQTKGNKATQRRDREGIKNVNKQVKKSSRNYRKVNEVDAFEDEEEKTSDYIVDSINNIHVDMVKKHWYVTLKINNVNVNLKIDTGADCNLLSISNFNNLNLKNKIINKTHDCITTYTKEIIPIIGTTILECFYNDKMYKIKFYITKNFNNILGLNACIILNVIQRVNAINNKYKNVINDEIGCINTKIHLTLDKSVKPKVAPFRRIPFLLHNQLKEELDKLVKLKIISPVDMPTEWVHNIVIVKKPSGKIRICLDPQQLNKALKRSHYPFPTIEEIASKLNGSKCFAKLDANSGYWMLPLDEESANICTFQTPFGRYKFLRMPFGLNCASEIFHRIISQIFERIEGVIIFQDDILIHAKNWDELESRKKQVFDVADKQQIKFNKEKCILRAEEITFLGHTFNKDGLKPDDDKIKAVKELKPPTDKKSLQRVLGFFNYLNKFIPNYAEVTGNMRELLKNDVIFQWNKHLEEDLNVLKNKIINYAQLKIFDPNEKITLSVDASSKGLGGCIIQNGRPIAFASKALNETQQRYAQIEKELLAVVFGCEKFKQYIYGQNIIIETDHKPLVPICEKPLCKLTSRLQRLMLKLQPYTFKMVHVPGKYLYVADTLSRDVAEPRHDNKIMLEEPIELQVNLLIKNLPVTEENWKLITTEGEKDENYKTLRNWIIKGFPKYREILPKEMQSYFDIKQTLTVYKNLIFKDDRILIPNSLKRIMLEKLHSGHPGKERMKNRALGTIYWLKINKDIEQYIYECDTCNKYQNNKQRSKLILRETPKLPWQEVGIDIFDYSNKNFIVIVDYLSNFIETSQLKDLRSTTIITKIKSVFARFGIPITVYTDGAKYFNCKEFKEFSKNWNFNHIISSPHYPQSNGMAESAVKTIKNLFKKCKDSNEDPYLALLNLRNTPREKMNSPAKILFSKNLRTNIPIQMKQLKPRNTLKEDIKNLEKHKQIYKGLYDKRTKKENIFNNDQNIMFRKKMEDTLVKGKIISQTNEPRSYVIQDELGNEYRRNEKHIFPRKSTENKTEEVEPEKDNNKEENNNEKDYKKEDKNVNIPNQNPEINPNNSKKDELTILKNFNAYTNRYGRKIVNKFNST